MADFLQKLQTGLLGAPQSYGGLLSADEQKESQRQAMIQIGLQLMAAGGPSSQPVGLGQAIGGAVQAGRQTQNANIEQSLNATLLKSQIEKAQQTAARSPKPLAVMKDGKPVYVGQDEAVGLEPYSPVQRSEAPAVIQEYKLYTEQAQAAGKQPLPYMDWLGERAKTNVGAPYQVIDFQGGRAITNRTNPSDIRQISTAEQEAAGAAAVAGATTSAQTTAKQIADAAFDLPRVEQNTSNAIKTLQQLRNHPGLSSITGLYSLAPVVPNTEQAAADALALQVEGQTFLEAFNMLKGSGVITEQEGSKATTAIGRLKRAQSTKDYQAAIDDLIEVLNNGVNLARKKASGSEAPKKRVRVDAQGNVIGN